MSAPATVQIAPGARVWWSGAMWHVDAVSAHDVVLRRDSEIARVSPSEIIGNVMPLNEGPPSSDDAPSRLGSVMLSQLPGRTRAQVEAEAGVIARALAREGSAGDRVRWAAKELGMSERTMRRRVEAFRRARIDGLVDRRATPSHASKVDARWDATLMTVLKSYTDASTPSILAVIDETNRQVVATHGTDIDLPARTTAYRRVEALSKGRHTFGSAKARRSVAKRPPRALGRLRADRPGEYVVLDTNSLDVFAMEPVTGRWVPVQLTVAMDLFSRCILGLRLTPVSTKSVDVANVLFQCLLPQSGAQHGWPYHGVPANLLVGTEEPDGVHQERAGGLPAVVPYTIVTDHGKQGGFNRWSQHL
ncbi:helix-turn-helix domain-containing protein, partial [Cellulomonas marina]